MPGLADLAMGAAPIAGGAMLGAAAGNIKAPDIRALITQDLDLLDRLPPEQDYRRAQLQRVIENRIDDLIAAADKNRSIREAAKSYQGNWRDIVVFICAVLFTFIWWNVSHSRPHWILTFILMIVLMTLAGIYAGRGIYRAVSSFLKGRGEDRHRGN